MAWLHKIMTGQLGITPSIANYLMKRKFMRNFLLLLIGIISNIVLEHTLKGSTTIDIFARKAVVLFIIITGIMVIRSVMMAILDSYISSNKQRNIPLKGFVQGFMMIVYFLAGIIIVAVLLNKSPSALLAGLGASAAILMLIFKDSILGFVAGVQLSQNKMIRIGDWIQLPDGSANGVVEEITLNTVKVRNWNNTLSMVPPYTLVSAPFINWRGMQESGGRRTDKMIYIDVTSMEICSEDMIKDIIKAYPILKGALVECDFGDLSNAQIYRTYITTYLKQHPNVNTALDIIISQKEATAYGMPIEVYFFTKEKDWALHEKQQSDIFDHLMTVAPDFGLRLYQRP